VRAEVGGQGAASRRPPGGRYHTTTRRRIVVNGGGGDVEGRRRAAARSGYARSTGSRTSPSVAEQIRSERPSVGCHCQAQSRSLPDAD